MMGEIATRMLAMRMLASHPSLLHHSADLWDDPQISQGSEYAALLRQSGKLAGLPFNTNKLTALVDMVNEILDEDPRHKVVIFSHFKAMIPIIRGQIKVPSVLITGDVSGRARDHAIQAFNKDPSVRMFVSSDAGAYGVDLNQGSHLINYDLPWSAGALSQRVARIDRTNSAFPVIQARYLYGHDTIEERMLRMLRQKQRVSGAFLDGKFDISSGSLKLDLETLREFLQR